MRVSDSMSRVTALGCDFVRSGHNGAAVWNGSRCALAAACNSELSEYHGVQVCDADSRCGISESTCPATINVDCACGGRARVCDRVLCRQQHAHGPRGDADGGHLALRRDRGLGPRVWQCVGGDERRCVQLPRLRVLGQMQAMEVRAWMSSLTFRPLRIILG